MITDGDLVLYFYRDGQSAARRDEIAAALARDTATAARFDALVADLARLAQVPDSAVPTAALVRWRSRLQRESAMTTSARSAWPSWALAAAMLVVGVALGLQFRAQDAAPGAHLAATPSSPGAAETAPLARGARLQLVRNDAELAQWETRTPDARRALVRQWLVQNRTLARAAELAGDFALARTLRALEPTLSDLLGVVDEPDTSGQLRERLAFEWAVTQTKLATSPSKQALQL